MLALAGLTVLLILTGRLWMLQLTQWTRYASLAAGNATSITYAPAPRGLIFDRTGRVVLADNRPVWNVAIVPDKLPDRQDKLEKVTGRLASILKVSMSDLRPLIQAAQAQKGRESVQLDDEVGADVPFPIVAQIEEQALPGVTITESALRMYPRGKLAAHILGYARSITEEQYQGTAREPGVKSLEYPDLSASEETPALVALPRDPLYDPQSLFGTSGLESQYEIWLDRAPAMPVLAGRRGRTVYEVDAALKPVRLIQYRQPAVGASLYLNIDAAAQEAAERELARHISGYRNRSGAVVAMDVEDGGIAVMASAPSYDPNDFVKRLPVKLWSQLNNDPRKPLLNKATSGGYPPASTFKLISTAAALELAKITPERRFTCTGRIVEDRTYKCWKLDGHGSVNLREAMAHSCDVYFYELIRKAGLTADDIHAQAADMFGLGEKTDIDLPEEIRGFVPSTPWKRETKKERWWTGDSLNMVIGQGWTTVTPLQMVRVCAAVANGGYLLQPHLVNRIVWPEHFRMAGPTQFGRVVTKTLPLRPETLQIVREGMRAAVTFGTAGSLKSFPVPVAAKTGSAQHIPGRTAHSWFICFAPYDKPKYAVAVFVAEGGHGSTTALPIARQVLAALLKVEAGAAAPAVPSD